MQKIGLEYVEELKKQSQEKVYNEMIAQLGEDGMVETEKAREAKRILEEAKIVITLDEKKELEKQSQEKEYNEMAKAFGGDGMVETEKAREAKKILEKANINITLDEKKALEKQSEGKTDEILTQSNLIIGLGETKEKVLFTAEEIGKATLKQQEQTEEKIQEESSRNANQKALEEELGKE